MVCPKTGGERGFETLCWSLVFTPGRSAKVTMQRMRILIAKELISNSKLSGYSISHQQASQTGMFDKSLALLEDVSFLTCAWAANVMSKAFAETTDLDYVCVKKKVIGRYSISGNAQRLGVCSKLCHRPLHPWYDIKRRQWRQPEKSTAELAHPCKVHIWIPLSFEAVLPHLFNRHFWAFIVLLYNSWN